MITASFFYRVSFYANCIRYRFNVSNKFSSLVIQQPRLTCKFESEKKVLRRSRGVMSRYPESNNRL